MEEMAKALVFLPLLPFADEDASAEGKILLLQTCHADNDDSEFRGNDSLLDLISFKSDCVISVPTSIELMPDDWS